MILLLALGTAWASPVYPATIASELGAPCDPPCTVCHATNAGGGGTVVQDFGLAMMDRGLSGGADSLALLSALASMSADGVDSDGDGVIDVDELSVGDDPNPGGQPYCDVLTPTYGCATAPGAGWAGVILGLGVMLRRRAGALRPRRRPG